MHGPFPARLYFSEHAFAWVDVGCGVELREERRRAAWVCRRLSYTRVEQSSKGVDVDVIPEVARQRGKCNNRTEWNRC